VASPAAEFIDRTLRFEGSEFRAEADAERIGGGLRFYGASVGAIRGTVRDAGRRHPGLTHDEVTALAAELWEEPVYERRLAAIVLLQGQVRMLRGNDLTRIEQFLRDARVGELVDPLATDVVRPLLDRLQGTEATRATRIIERWATDPENSGADGVTTNFCSVEWMPSAATTTSAVARTPLAKVRVASASLCSKPMHLWPVWTTPAGRRSTNMASRSARCMP